MQLAALKETLHWSDFYPSSPRKSHLRSRSQADLIFSLPKPESPRASSIVPSLALELASEVTSDHALGNRHHAKGRADVDYWFEATFIKQSKKIFATAGAVHVPEPAALRVTPRESSQRLHFRASKPTRVLPLIKARRKPAAQDCELAVRLEHDLGTVRATKASAKDRVKLRVPFRVEVAAGRNATSPIESLVQRGAECEVTAKWYVSRGMNSVDQRRQQQQQQHHGVNSLSRSSAIAQNLTIAIPPFYEQPRPYDDSGPNESIECSADALIELALPVSAMTPTIKIPGLSIEYGLELKLAFQSITFDQNKANSPVGIGSVSLKIPVVLETA